MKKLITLMAFGMVCASMGAAVVQVTDANKKVSGPYTYVAVPNFNNLVLEYRHTFKPEGNFTKAYMAYIDENGNELRSFDIVGAKGDDGTYQLAYTDMARLANGYRFAFFDENLAKSFETSTLVSGLSESVKWDGDDVARYSLTSVLEGKTLKGGDVIVAKCNKDGGLAQLYWNDGGEKKYGNSADATLNNNEDWATAGAFGGAKDCQRPNSDGTYDFVLTSAMASAINERVAAGKEVYFTGQGGITLSGVDLKVVTYTGETNVTSYDLTRTENKVSVFDELPKPSESTVTTTEADNLDKGVNWSNGESGGFGLKESLGDKTFKEGDIITVYCTGTSGLHAQLWWKDDESEIKYGNSADLNLNTADWEGDGSFGAARDCQLANEDGSYDFVLTAEMAEAMNARFKAGNEVYFNGQPNDKGEVVIKVNKITYTTTESNGSKAEWHLLTLWTPAHDEVVPMYGFEAGIWGFAGKNKEFDDFQDWGKIEGNNFHDIKQVEEYFAEHTDGWFCNQRSPEYWSVIVPRFDAELGDWVVIAIDPDEGTEVKGENTDVTKQCMFQLWNIETKDGNLVENIYKLDPESDYPEIDVLSNWRYNDEYRYIYIKLDNEAKVNAAKNGLRFKGTNFTIHRVGWIHKTTDKIVEYTEVESRYHIHVLPEAFKAHSQWNIVNFSADECRPSKSSTTDHDGGSSAHKFAETINLNFATAKDHGYKVKVEFYTYLPNGTENPSDFPIADFIDSDEIKGLEQPEIKIGDETVAAFPAGGYQPKDFSDEKYDHTHYDMTVAGYEVYECNRHGDGVDASHAVSATWYKPLSNIVRSLETYGLYARVILTKQVEVTPAMRRAPMLINDGVTNLNFEPLTGDLKDDYILYALPDVSKGVKLTPVVYYNRVGIANNAGIRTTTGLETIGDDTEAPVEIYNLQGIRVSEMTPGQIYIVRQGSKVEKIAR